MGVVEADQTSPYTYSLSATFSCAFHSVRWVLCNCTCITTLDRMLEKREGETFVRLGCPHFWEKGKERRTEGKRAHCTYESGCSWKQSSSYFTHVVDLSLSSFWKPAKGWSEMNTAVCAIGRNALDTNVCCGCSGLVPEAASAHWHTDLFKSFAWWAKNEMKINSFKQNSLFSFSLFLSISIHGTRISSIVRLSWFYSRHASENSHVSCSSRYAYPGPR